MRQKIAIVGTGISGLGSAYLLSQTHDVTVLEVDNRLGGHSHTVDIQVDGHRFGVDTGFLVFNERTYPLLCKLFAHLKIPVVPSEMSFSVQIDQGRLEWAGTNLDTVFAQRRNLLRPKFWSMLWDIVRFNRCATRDMDDARVGDTTLGKYLNENGYGAAFRNDYLLPMAAAIWSCPTAQMLDYPFHTFARFCHNHGLLQVTDRPTWMTVAGGSKVYVDTLASEIRAHGGDIRLNAGVTRIERVSAGIAITTPEQTDIYDQVVMACHSDQAWQLLGDTVTPHEQRALSAIRYQPNRAVLHTDAALLPKNNKVWSAWNYATPGLDSNHASDAVTVSYLINKLQPLPTETPVIVSLNPCIEPDPAKTYRNIHYAHPVFDGPAIAAQSIIKSLSGLDRIHYAGAWLGYGFHEDGFASAVRVAGHLMKLPEWLVVERGELNKVPLSTSTPQVVHS